MSFSLATTKPAATVTAIVPTGRPIVNEVQTEKPSDGEEPCGAGHTGCQCGRPAVHLQCTVARARPGADDDDGQASEEQDHRPGLRIAERGGDHSTCPSRA
jgi:hypothetical protein